MIPQIIKKSTQKFCSSPLQEVKKKQDRNQTTKKLSFYGVGDCLAYLGQKTRTTVMENTFSKSFFKQNSVQKFARLSGFSRDIAPWELRYVARPVATWGAFSKAIMERNKRHKDVSSESSGDTQEEVLRLDVAVSDHDWYQGAIAGQGVQGARIKPEKNDVRSQQKPSKKIKKAAKMVASKKRESTFAAAETEHAFVAVHHTIDTQKELDKPLIVIGQKELRQVSQYENLVTFVEKVGSTVRHNFLVRRNCKQVEERGGVRSLSVSTLGVLAGLFLCLFAFSSVYFAIPQSDAIVKVQNFMKQSPQITAGLQILSYENQVQASISSKGEFDSGQYSKDQFESGSDDLVARTSDDLTLAHYGDNPPSIDEINWWDDDSDPVTNYNWRYRNCFAVDNTASADDLVEHQIYLDFDTASLITSGKMLSNGNDVRFVSQKENVLAHYVADDFNSATTKVWVQIDEVLAGEVEAICMYYGNPGASDTASREDVFTYDSAKQIYHVVADSAEGSVTDFVSYSDNNDVTVSGFTGTLDRTQFDSHPVGSTTYTEASAVGTTHPINAAYNENGVDNLVPVAAAATEFVYRTDRYTNEFSIISPWCSASLTFTNGGGNNILDTQTNTSSPFVIAAGASRTIRTNDTAANGIADNVVVIIEEDGADCPVLISHHGSVGGDSYTMFGASNEWYGVGSGSLNVGVLQDATAVTVYKSNGTTVGPTVYNRGQGFNINDTGSQGSEVAHRIVADKPIGVQARGDGDGGDAVTFLPADELGLRYFIADISQYIAVATTAGRQTTVDLYFDGTNCGVGVPDDTATVSATGDFPGKVYFGSTAAGDNIPAGACIVADNPIYVYNEFNTQGDEHNIWNEKQNRQFLGAQPSYTIGQEEAGSWILDGTNSWIYRTPVTITNTASVPLDEYQLALDFSTDLANIFGKTQSDGGDLRLAGPLGDGTDDLPYALESFDVSTSSGTLWMQIPSIAASATTTVYVYYAPIGLDVNAMNPRLWLDAADSTTITSTVSSVSAWNDKSGSLNNVSQTTLADQPSLSADNNRQIIAFNGSFMTDPDGIWGATTYNDSYVFTAFRNLNLADNGILFGERIQAGRYEAGSPQGGNAFYQPNRNSGGSISGPYAGDTTNYHTMRFEAHAGSDRTIYRDDVVLVTDANGMDFRGQNREFSLGGRENGASLQSVNMGEMIIFPAALSVAQVSSIESYLSQKWVTGPTTTLTTTGNYDAIWQTSVAKPNYYVVDERAVAAGSLDVISFGDGNMITFGADSTTVPMGSITTLPLGAGITQADIYSVKGPLHIGFDSDTTDTALPIGYAGQEFVMRVGRSADVFSFYAPFEEATIEIQQSAAAGFTTLQTVTVPAQSAISVSQDIINDRAFKIISDEPILAFHRNATSDAKILHPVDQAYVESSDQYEIYGVPSGALQLAATTTTSATIYRSDGTQSTVTLDGTTNFGYSESSAGVQGTARAYRIVSDDPIGASSYADGDGGEAAIFVSQKEFSDEYIITNPTQYMSIVTRDPSVECRVFDAAGAAVTTGPAAMDNIPPQTSGLEDLPYPNQIHIGGGDAADGAYFSAGYRLECDEPVYAYYEHHLSGAISDETNWLTWPQARTRNYIEPTVEDPDTTDEQGLYYASGFAGTSPFATADYIFDVSTETFGEHTYWRDIIWDEIITDRGALGGVQQVKIESAYADGPNCAASAYSSFVEATGTETLSTSSDTSPPFHSVTTNTKKAVLDADATDHDCLKIRLTLSTGDPALSPVIPEFAVQYYVGTLLEGQLSAPQINVTGTVGTTDEKFRIAKILNNDPGLINSQAHLSFRSVSSVAPFTTADFELLELPSKAINPQFTFPAFPLSTLHASTSSPLDINNDVAIYYTGQRSAGANEQINMTLNLDIAGAGGPQITRDFTLEVEG